MAKQKLRERYADDVLGSIKQVALRQLADGGPAAVSINAIGRELGVSGPALYRYVAGWDELVTTLTVDAYDDLAAALRTAAASQRTRAPRLAACGTAYREWALAQPHRYRLLFDAPRPGDEHDGPQVVDASQAAMNVLIDVLADLPDRAETPATGIPDWLQRRGRPAGDTVAAEAAIRLWGRLHGLVSLELSGCFTSMGIDVTPLYAREIQAELN